LELIAEQVNAVRAEAEAGTLEKARCLGYLAAIALRAVEVAELAERVDALERALKDRKANPAHDDDCSANAESSSSREGVTAASEAGGQSVMRLA
jgi:hypothetical protein